MEEEDKKWRWSFYEILQKKINSEVWNPKPRQ
jgi:hypothetical protein